MITTQSELTISSINNWNLYQWNYSKLLLITSCTCTTTVLNTGWADIPPSKYSQAGPIFSILTQVSILTQHHSFNTRVEMLAKISCLYKSLSFFSGATQTGTPAGKCGCPCPPCRDTPSLHLGLCKKALTYPIAFWPSPNTLPVYQIQSYSGRGERKTVRDNFPD